MISNLFFVFMRNYFSKTGWTIEALKYGDQDWTPFNQLFVGVEDGADLCDLLEPLPKGAIGFKLVSRPIFQNNS